MQEIHISFIIFIHSLISVAYCLCHTCFKHIKKLNTNQTLYWVWQAYFQKLLKLCMWPHYQKWNLEFIVISLLWAIVAMVADHTYSRQKIMNTSSMEYGTLLFILTWSSDFNKREHYWQQKGNNCFNLCWKKTLYQTFWVVLFFATAIDQCINHDGNII